MGLPSVYYRLKAVDKSGETNYSMIRAVKIAGHLPLIHISPNPAKERLTIAVKEVVTSPIQLRILNTMGKVLEETTLETESTSLSIAHFPAGIYWFEMTINGIKQVEKVVLD